MPKTGFLEKSEKIWRFHSWKQKKIKVEEKAIIREPFLNSAKMPKISLKSRITSFVGTNEKKRKLDYRFKVEFEKKRKFCKYFFRDPEGPTRGKFEHLNCVSGLIWTCAP